MESHEIQRIAQALAFRAGKEADAEQISDAFVGVCQEINAVLEPIIGPRGVAALFKRSLYLTGNDHPWLAGSTQIFESPIDFAVLKSELAEQSSGSANAGGNALLMTLYQLLASMVGPSVTERLLRSVWVGALTDLTTQETK